MMTRIQFLRSLAGLGVGVFGVAAVAGCASSDDGGSPDAGTGTAPTDASSGQPTDGSTPPPVDAPPMACASATGAIGSNHGHAITLSPADVAGTTDRTYAIKGSSPHPHTVVITAAQFAMLRATGTVTVMSTVDAGHAHSVIVTCA